jgi:hypothetical protein
MRRRNESVSAKDAEIRNGPGNLAGAGTFSRFDSTIPRERRNRLSARLQVPKERARGLAGSTIFRVLFTMGQTLPPFPASIAKPDGYPLPCLAVQKVILWMASAHRRALGPFLFCANHLVLKGHAFGIVFREPRFSGVRMCEHGSADR